MKQLLYALGLVAVLGLGACGDQSSAKQSTLPPGIGDVSVAIRMVHGTLANQDVRRILAVRDDVYWRELIETGTDSATEVQFVDGTRLTLGSDAKVNLDEFVYGGPPGTDRLVMTVTKGVSRFVTGSMDKAAYEIRAPGAIIGVRGTDFTLFVDDDAEATLCVVHGGEVEFRQANGGKSVIVQPGKASSASLKNGTISPAAPPPKEVIELAEQLRMTVDSAREQQKNEQRTALLGDTARGKSTQPQENTFGRERLQDFVEQLRNVDNGRSTEAAAPPPSRTAMQTQGISSIAALSDEGESTGGGKAHISGGGPGSGETDAVKSPKPTVPVAAPPPAEVPPPAQPTPVPMVTPQPEQNACIGVGCATVPIPIVGPNRIESQTTLR